MIFFILFRVSISTLLYSRTINYQTPIPIELDCKIGDTIKISFKDQGGYLVILTKAKFFINIYYSNGQTYWENTRGLYCFGLRQPATGYIIYTAMEDGIHKLFSWMTSYAYCKVIVAKGRHNYLSDTLIEHQYWVFIQADASAKMKVESQSGLKSYTWVFPYDGTTPKEYSSSSGPFSLNVDRVARVQSANVDYVQVNITSQGSTEFDYGTYRYDALYATTIPFYYTAQDDLHYCQTGEFVIPATPYPTQTPTPSVSRTPMATRTPTPSVSRSPTRSLHPTPMPTPRFTQSNSFTSSAIFTQSKTYSDSFSFTSSNLFTQSNLFTKSLSFSQSNLFSISNLFTDSYHFTKSDIFSDSNIFSSSNLFTQSSSFTKSEIFSNSEDFSSSFPFSKSQPFSSSSTFSKSQLFSLSDYFTETKSFSQSTEFTRSSVFSNSFQFTDSNSFQESFSFSSSKQFTESNAFTKSDSFYIISPSSHFSKSYAFTMSSQFTKSDTFDMKNSSLFSQSSYFSSQIELVTSEPISISHLETLKPTKSIPQQTTINEETHSSTEISGDENAENINKNSQKSNTNIVIIVGVVVGTVAVSAAAIIGAFCCMPIGIVPAANDEEETGPFDSNAGIDTGSISSEFEPFQDDESMNEIYDPNDFEIMI